METLSRLLGFEYQLSYSLSCVNLHKFFAFSVTQFLSHGVVIRIKWDKP